MEDHQARQGLVVEPNRTRFGNQFRIAGLVGIVSLLPVLMIIGLLAFGDDTSEGLGALAIPVVVVVIALPVLLWLIYVELSMRNSLIWMEADAVYVRSWTGRRHRLIRPTAVPWDNCLLISDQETAVVIDPRRWDAPALDRLRATLPVSERFGPSSSGAVRREHKTFAGPMWHRRTGAVTVFWILFPIFYIFAIVNVAYRL